MMEEQAIECVERTAENFWTTNWLERGGVVLDAHERKGQKRCQRGDASVRYDICCVTTMWL